MTRTKHNDQVFNTEAASFRTVVEMDVIGHNKFLRDVVKAMDWIKLLRHTHYLNRESFYKQAKELKLIPDYSYVEFGF